MHDELFENQPAEVM